MAAPLFGRPDVAAQQKLWICMADKPEAANAVKLTGNFLILSMVEVLAEAFAFAEKNGIDVKIFHDFLKKITLTLYSRFNRL